MAQTAYKYKGSVSNGRHVANGLLIASVAAMGEFHPGLRDEDGYAEAKDLLREVQELLKGHSNYSKAQQVEALFKAREKVAKALKLVQKIDKVETDAPKGVKAFQSSALDMLEMARNHLTSVLQFAKDRKFEVVAEMTPYDAGYADYAKYDVDYDDEE